MKFGLKIKKAVLKIWKDPVLSKVIATGLLGLIAIGWAKLTNHSWNEIYLWLLVSLKYKLPVFIFLSIIGLYFVFKLSINLFRKEKDEFWDAQMGNYTFKELYNILITETFPVQNVGMKMSLRPAPTDDLLTLFRIYYTFLNKGVGIEDNLKDGGYLYSALAPRLVGFGLVEPYQKPDNFLRLKKQLL